MTTVNPVALAAQIIEAASRTAHAPRRGDEAPAELLGSGPGDVVSVILSPELVTEGGAAVSDADCISIGKAVQGIIRERSRTDLALAVDPPIVVRRAVEGDAAWKTFKTTVTVGAPRAAPPPVPRTPPSEPRAEVQLGEEVLVFSSAESRHVRRYGGGALVIDESSDGLMFHPKKLEIHTTGGTHVGPIRLPDGRFEIRERWHQTWYRLRRPGRLTTGEVLWQRRSTVAAAPSSVCQISGLLNDILDAARPTRTVDNGGRRVGLSLEPATGILSLLGLAGPVTGRGSLPGRLLLDPQRQAQFGAGENVILDVGGKALELRCEGESTERLTRKVRSVPAAYAKGAVPGGDVLFVNPDARGLVVNVGELLLGPTARALALFRALVRCKVDGRWAEIDDLLPVRPNFSLWFAGTSLHPVA